MTDLDRATALLSIDLGAVAANWRLIRDRAAGAECAAVVKADCYGLGAGRVVQALWQAGCRSFFVATLDEGIEVRRLVPDGRIFVLLGPLPGTEADFAAHALIPVLNSLDQVAQWSAFARATGSAEAVLHLDTGMSRLGLSEGEVVTLANRRDLLDGLTMVLVMSHMACADEWEHPKNRDQLETFRRLQAMMPAGCPRSLAASSTVFLGPDYHFGLVRPGAALYGLNPQPGRPNPMHPVVRLRARILQVRDVDTPMTVGYGASHRVPGKSRIAAVAAGYADGLFRSLGNRGFGVIGGQRVPVVGRISMDLTTFDVGAVAPEVARPGAFIELIGADHDVDALAAEGGTIGYEVLTALGRRYLRHYEG